MKINKKIYFWLALALIIILGIFWAVKVINAPAATQKIAEKILGENELAPTSTNKLSPAPVVPKKTTLVFGGDVMLSRVVGQKMVKYQDFFWPFKNVASIFKDADIAAVNLESPFTYGGDHTVLTGSFAFNADPKAISGLKDAGIDLITLANNHFGDKGQNGMLDTFDLLAKNQIEYVGAGKNFTEARQGKIIEANGFKFGFLGYGYLADLYVATGSVAGIANMNIEQAKKDVSEFKKKVDILIVEMHAGTEFIASPNKQQKDFAHAVIDAGADLVIGHHPHWVQTTEIYQGKPILYSLGNLVFDQMWSRETQQGAIAKAYFKDKNLEKIEIIPIHIYDYGQPQIVKDKIEIEEILKRMNLKSEIINIK